MSYFMTVSGRITVLPEMPPIEFVQADKAQYYVQRLSKQLSALDGEPLFLIHDGSSGTSDEIVSPVKSSIQISTQMGQPMEQPIEDTPLYRLLTALSEFECVIRIWWADNTTDAYLRVMDCSSLEDVIHEFQEQSREAAYVGIRARFPGHNLRNARKS